MFVCLSEPFLSPDFYQLNHMASLFPGLRWQAHPRRAGLLGALRHLVESWCQIHTVLGSKSRKHNQKGDQMVCRWDKRWQKVRRPHFSVTCAHVARLFVRQGRMCNDNVFFQNETSNLKIINSRAWFSWGSHFCRVSQICPHIKVNGHLGDSRSHTAPISIELAPETDSKDFQRLYAPKITINASFGANRVREKRDSGTKPSQQR